MRQTGRRAQSESNGSTHERGATMVEYGFVMSLIAAVVALAVGPFGAAVAALLMQGVEAFP